MKINAVVLAGRPNKGALSEENAAQEALIDIAGKPMIIWVIDALRQSEYIAKISVVTAPEARKVVESCGAQWVEAGDSLTENVRRGASSLPRDEAVLMVSGDIPLIKGYMLDEFISRAVESKAGVVYPIVEKFLCEQKYPLVKRTYVTLQEGTFTGGNFVLLQPGVLPAALRLLQRVYAARKKPWRLAAMLGWRFIYELLTHKAHLDKLEKRAGQLLGVEAQAVRVSYPEVGIDVDKPDDLKLARSALA